MKVCANGQACRIRIWPLLLVQKSLSCFSASLLPASLSPSPSSFPRQFVIQFEQHGRHSRKYSKNQKPREVDIVLSDVHVHPVDCPRQARAYVNDHTKDVSYFPRSTPPAHRLYPPPADGEPTGTSIRLSGSAA